MADSVTYEEFVKQENRKSEMSPTDTETTLEDLQSTISEIQDSLKTLSIESKTNQIQQETKQKEVQQFMQEFQIPVYGKSVVRHPRKVKKIIEVIFQNCDMPSLYPYLNTKIHTSEKWLECTNSEHFPTYFAHPKKFAPPFYSSN